MARHRMILNHFSGACPLHAVAPSNKLSLPPGSALRAGSFTYFSGVYVIASSEHCQAYIDMVNGRELSRDEIKEIWSIDRSEVIDAVYYLDHGTLRLRSVHYVVPGWPPGESEQSTPILEACHDRDGWLYGLFDGQVLVGVAVLDSHFMGGSRDQLQLVFLHVSRPYRHHGTGQNLFKLAQDEAVRRGARRLYISATPSQHTIDFYLRLGCVVTAELDQALYELEPEDIHLECTLG